MGGSSRSPIPISDDEEEKLAAPPAAAFPHEEQELPAAADWPVDDEDTPAPDWLPDGFGFEGYYDDDGTFQATNFICPVSGITFRLKKEVLNYCSSGGLERAAESMNTLKDETTLQGKYAWLRGKPGWVMEIRAGGENMSKMYKFFAHLSSGVRLQSKAEVIRYVEEGQLPNRPANDGDWPNTSNDDNIIAQIDINLESLPPGWVKEIAFRKCSDGTVRKDRYYTDPVTKRMFRSLKAAKECFIDGQITNSYKPLVTVTEAYSFDWCTYMPPWLANRLKIDGSKEQGEEECQTSHLGAQPHALNGGGKGEENKQDAPHGIDVVANEELMLPGDGDDNGRKMKRHCSLAKICQAQNAKCNLKGKGKKKE